jgi:hypothetical protein
MIIQLQKILKFSCVVSFITTLIACGGGSGSATDNEQVSSTESESTETQVAPVTQTPSPIASSSDSQLDIDPRFNLRSTYQLEVDVDLDLNQRAYFSLCEDTGGDSAYEINYEDCLIRAALSQGKLIQTIKVANHQSELVAAIWFYDGKEPLLYKWQASAEEEQSLSIN